MRVHEERTAASSQEGVVIVSVEWATAPLNDPANVGKNVWVSGNSNKPTVTHVGDVTKHCILVGYSRQKLRVSDDGGTANSPPSAQWPTRVWTDAALRVKNLNSELRSLVQKRLARLTDDDVARIAELFEIELPG